MAHEHEEHPAVTRRMRREQAQKQSADQSETAVGRRSRRWWPWAVGAVLAAGAGAVAFVAVLGAVLVVDAASVRSDLTQAKQIIGTLKSTVASGDVNAAAASSEQLRTLTSAANATVQKPIWSLASNAPAVGNNIDAVRRVTIAVDILVEDALPGGLQLASDLSASNAKVAGGGIDLTPLRNGEAQIAAVSAAFAAAKTQIEPIDQAALLPTVAQPVADLIDTIDAAAPALDILNRHLPALIDAAGGNGTKTYLVVFQNNAEIRATGGNPAASMIITVNNGQVQMQDQASSATFGAAGDAGIAYTELPSETASLYLSTINTYSQDFTMTPDFPTTAEFFQNLLAGTAGDHFDGVISIDPVVLASMLSVAGPVTLSDGEQIGADNAVRVLLSDAYARYPSAADSDRFFADVAERVFLHLVSGGWNPVDMLNVLQTSAAQQRIHLAFTDPGAASLAKELNLEGALREDNTESTQIGIYLNDYSVGKLEYHLATSIQVGCDASARTVTTTMSMTNSIPDSVTSDYVLGARNGKFGFDRRTMMLDVLYFAPPGASIVSIDPAEGDVPSLSRSGTEKGNTAQSELIAVKQGQTRTVSYTVQLPEGDLGPLELRHTPTTSETPVVVDASCAALMK